jgi:hypothetical protein
MDGAERFGVPEALEDLRRHGVVALDEVKVVPLRFDGDKAVVALDWGTGPELVVKVASHQPQKHVRVMLDPAGHPFCLWQGPV